MPTNASIAFSNQVTHIGSGASIATGGMSGSADISTALTGTGNLGRYPTVDLVLTIAPTASVASTSNAVYCYRRDLNVDGTADENVPGASNKSHFCGAFTVGVTGTAASQTHVMTIANVDIPATDCEFYIESALAVNIPAGWSLKVTPKTVSVS